MRIALAALALLTIVSGAVWFATRAGEVPSAAGSTARSGVAPRVTPALHAVEPSTAPLTGVVVDEHGTPVADAEVTAFAPVPALAPLASCTNWLFFPTVPTSCSCGAAAQVVAEMLAQRSRRQPIATATTDASGRYTLPAAADDREVWLSARKGELSGEQVRALGTKLELGPSAVISGVVHDGDGAPIADALVGAPEGDGPQVRTGGDGAFSLRLPKGRGRVAAAKAGLVADVAMFEGTMQVTLVLTKPVTVRGRVVRGGAPVAGATVRQTMVPCSARVDTAADGTFELPNMRAQPLYLEAASGAFSGKLEVPAGTLDGLVIELKQAVLVEGHVFDEHGAPLGNAHIEARRDDDELNQLAVATTEPNGHFTLAPLRPGRWSVVAELEGFRRATEKLVLEHPAAQVELQLERGGGIRGHVVDERGQPIANAWLQSGELSARPLRRPETANSRADGAFDLNNLAPGAHKLEISSPDFESLSLDVTSPAEDLRITLRSGAFVSGRVFDRQGHAIAVPVPAKDPLAVMQLAMRGRVAQDGVEIRLTSDDAAGWGRGLADGSYRSSPLKKGRYEVCAVLGEREGCGSVTVVAGEHAQLDLTVPDALGIFGFVRDEKGQPIAGARVVEPMPLRANPIDVLHVGVRPSTTTDANGAFAFEDLADGDHTFTVSAIGYGSTEVVFPAGTTNVTVRLKASGTIKGRVMGDDGPLAAATVNAFAVGADGRFEIDRLTAGNRLRVMAKDYADLSHPLQSEREGTIDVGDLRLTRGQRLAGRVTDAAGAPVEGAKLFCSRSGGAASSDARGRFTLEHLGEPPYQLLVNKEGWAPTSLDPVSPGDDVHVVLSRGIRLTGVAVDEREKPIAGLEFACTDQRQFFKQATTDETGSFELAGVPAGTIHCDASSARAAVPVTTVVVEPDHDAKVVIHGRVGGTRVRLKDGASLPFVRLLDGVIENKRIPEASREPTRSNDDLVWPAVPAGRYTLAIPFGDYTHAIVEDVTSTGSGEIVVDLSDEDRKELGLE